MEKFTVLEGVAAPLKLANIDTDRIVPKQYLKTIKRTGLGKGLFAELRYKDDGSENPEFVLNQPAYRKAKILVAGENFGCGSSREHAPWALLDYGIQAVISSEIADIFRGNSLKNGLLAIVLSTAEHRWLLDNPGVELRIDIASGTIRLPDGGNIHFDLEPFARHCLLNGVDQMGFLLQQDDAIGAYEQRMEKAA
jgi:3-isopropylmalate/(R)-2-methylmalate dehydratase small subunit